MKKISLISILMFFSLLAIGQSDIHYEMARRLEIERINLMNRSRSLDELNLKENNIQLKVYDKRKEAIREIFYRNSTKEELERMSLNEEEKKVFSELLKKKNIHFIKLVKDLGCDELSINKNANNTICQTLSMPGGGSAYSFRRKDYQQWKLADLLYDGKVFIAFGEIAQSFLVDIGKVDLDKVNFETNGAKFVFSFIPKKSIEELESQNSVFFNGLKDGYFSYNRFLPAVKGNTYILRSIAYRGTIKRQEFGLVYNELSYDERKDVIIAFTVLDIDFNGTVTIIWKELQNQDSPKIKIEKNK